MNAHIAANRDNKISLNNIRQFALTALGFKQAFGIANDMEGYIALLYCFACQEIANVSAGQAAGDNIIVGGGVNINLYNCLADAGIGAGMGDGFVIGEFILARTKFAAIRAAAIDLIACEQVKPLKAINYKNYFASCNFKLNQPVIIANITKHYAAVATSIISVDANATALAINTKAFLRYHTAYASTPRLVKMVQVATDATTAWSNATKATVDAAVAAPWKSNLVDAIPIGAIAFTAAYLKSMKRYPEDWFQGQRAIESVAPNQWALYCAVCDKIKALNADANLINAVANLAGFAPILGANSI